MKRRIIVRILVIISVLLLAVVFSVQVSADGIDLGSVQGFFLSGLSFDAQGNTTQFYTDSANGKIYIMNEEDGLLYERAEQPQYSYFGYTKTGEKQAVDFFLGTADNKLYILGDDGSLSETSEKPQVSYDDVLSGVLAAAQGEVQAEGEQPSNDADDFLKNDGYDKYEPEFYCDDPQYGAFYKDESGTLYHFDEMTGEFIVAQDAPTANAQFADDATENAAQAAAENICHVKVIGIISDITGTNEYGGFKRTQMLSVKVLDGDYKGQMLSMKYEMSDTMGEGAITEPAKPGDKMIGYFAIDSETGAVTGVVTDYARSEKLIILAVIFVLLLLFLGGMRAMRSLGALLVTCLSCIFLMVPAILKGVNPILAAILAGIVAITVTLLLVYGFTMKTLAAGVGAFAGVVFSGILTAIMNSVMKMTGVVDCDSIDLALINLPGLYLSDVLFATIVISALGGTIDVGISIASSLDEIREKAPDIKGSELFSSGINIGVDIMGASLNTLILSYVGGSLTVLLIVMYYSSINNMTTLLNDEMIASELLQALIGSMGLLCTVPITSLVAARMMCKKGNFGKITLDCFPALKKFTSLFAPLFKKAKNTALQLSPEKAAFDEPENLYEAAVKRSRELYKNAEGSSYSEPEDDFDLGDIDDEEDA